MYVFMLFWFQRHKWIFDNSTAVDSYSCNVCIQSLLILVTEVKVNKQMYVKSYSCYILNVSLDISNLESYHICILSDN